MSKDYEDAIKQFGEFLVKHASEIGAGNSSLTSEICIDATIHYEDGLIVTDYTTSNEGFSLKFDPKKLA